LEEIDPYQAGSPFWPTGGGYNSRYSWGRFLWRTFPGARRVFPQPGSSVALPLTPKFHLRYFPLFEGKRLIIPFLNPIYLSLPTVALFQPDERFGLFFSCPPYRFSRILVASPLLGRPNPQTTPSLPRKS